MCVAPYVLFIVMTAMLDSSDFESGDPKDDSVLT
jgi:hypothetical protein